jgi:uncharacterized 2Fe-2S/4Fe-4S cluster protein (DUF4445 family)
MSPDSSSSSRLRIRLEPLAAEIDVPHGGSLIAGLAAHGVEFPCGGKGNCGGCGVRVVSGSLAVTDADRGFFSADQLAAGWRLACRARAPIHVQGPLVLECGQWQMEILADGAKTLTVPSSLSEKSKRRGLGIAIDLGTTTIAAQVVGCVSGDVIGVETALNPQSVFGSDVMSRVRAGLEGKDLTTPIRTVLDQIVERLAAGSRNLVNEVVLVGNTVMHHLFSSLNVEPLSHTPFASPNLGEQRFTPRDLGWDLPTDCVIRFVRCIGGFVGSDILTGIIATSIARSDRLVALVDLGTNGEIAIGNRQGIVCASTAAGPAFEAGSVRMGMRAVIGAIAYVTLHDGALHATVLGDAAPRGICGSGLVDAVAAGLRTGAILASGQVAGSARFFPVAPPVTLYQSDIRELQLAKGAIAAGFRLLLKHLGATVDDLSAIYLAGAFGNYIQIDSAIAIGLIEAPRSLVHAAGNTALRGAKMLLLADQEPALPPIEHISLASDAAFEEEFAACMAFPAPS